MLQCLNRSFHGFQPGQPQTLVLLSRLFSQRAAANEQTFPLSPGGLLHICCTQPGTSVTIQNGAEDAVSLQVHDHHSQAQSCASASNSTVETNNGSSVNSTPFVMQLLPGGRIVEVIETASHSSSTDAGTAATTAAQPSSVGTRTLSAAMPSRFCGVHASTVGGAVSVARVQEADMHLVTRGGPATVKHCKANHAAINTAQEPPQQGPGGSQQIGELSASHLRLSSGGGAISVQRMFGLDAQVLTEGGPLSIGALYGVKAQLDSGRGPISVGHMSCSGLAMLQSGGHSLTVDGLEGNASIISGGGKVKVHLHERFGHVFVDSGGGAVEAWINPAAAVTLQVAAGGGVELDPGLKVTGEWGPVSLKGVTAGNGSQGTAAGAPPISSSSSALFAQPAGSSFNSSRLQRSSGEVAQLATGEQLQGSMVQAANSSSSACCKAQSSVADKADCHSNAGCGTAGRQVRALTINAGGGRVTLKAMGWMDAIRARLERQAGRQPEQQ